MRYRPEELAGHGKLIEPTNARLVFFMIAFVATNKDVFHGDVTN